MKCENSSHPSHYSRPYYTLSVVYSLLIFFEVSTFVKFYCFRSSTNITYLVYLCRIRRPDYGGPLGTCAIFYCISNIFYEFQVKSSCGSFSNYGTFSRFLCPRGSNHVLNILPIYILFTSKQWGIILEVRSFIASL